MQTPDNFQETALQVICANCKKNIATRDSNLCKKCNGIVRQNRSRILRSPDVLGGREAVRPFTEALVLPSSPGERQDTIWEELLRLDHLLTIHGPATLKLRTEVRAKASAIRQYLAAKAKKDSGDAFQYVHAVELLADVGSESPINFLSLRNFAAESVAFHGIRKDGPRLARSILVYANSWRLEGYEAKAKRIMRSSLPLLRRCDQKDPYVQVLLHNTLLHYLRFYGAGMDRADSRAIKEELLRLAFEVGTPNIRLETHRELVNFWNIRGDRDRAMKEFEELEILRIQHPFPEYGIPSLLRPKIHVLMESGNRQDRQKGLEVIANEYLDLYLKDRHCYYRDTLLRWKRQYSGLDLDVHLPTPEYGAVILTYLPRTKVDAA